MILIFLITMLWCTQAFGGEYADVSCEEGSQLCEGVYNSTIENPIMSTAEETKTYPKSDVGNYSLRGVCKDSKVRVFISDGQIVSSACQRDDGLEVYYQALMGLGGIVCGFILFYSILAAFLH
jgi:hypothetical protein